MPKKLTVKPIPKALATTAEIRAIKRGRAEGDAGKSMSYEQYRAQV